MQRDHVEVMGWVFSSSEDGLPILGYFHSRRTKVDGASMGTELRNRHRWEVYVVELVTDTCCLWQVTKIEAISCLCLHGTTIGATHSDTFVGILVVGAVVGCWDKVVSGSTI